MKKTLKLIPAIVMLLVSAILVSTSTYAWFSMNNRVTVTGMKVETKVSSNLLIAPDTIGATEKKGDEDFTDSLTQTVLGILEPVSTANALSFYYTVGAKASGEAINSSAYTLYNSSATPEGANSSAYADRFSEVYGVTKSSATATYNEKAVPYVDYVFQLKAGNTTNAPQYINLEKLQLTYTKGTNDIADTSTAHRIAVFVEDITNAATASATPIENKGTYAVTSSANFDGKVVNNESTLVDASYIGAPTTLATVEANTTNYYKVVVRMWLEGQDTTCNNTTFMKLTGDWKLDIELALVDSNDTGVTSIAKV